MSEIRLKNKKHIYIQIIYLLRISKNDSKD